MAGKGKNRRTAYESMGPKEIERLRSALEKTPRKARNIEVPDNGGLEKLIACPAKFPSVQFNQVFKECTDDNNLFLHFKPHT